jgi:hypothetical protein
MYIENARTRVRLRGPKIVTPDNRARISELKTQIGNLGDAVARGAIKVYPALAGKLAAAEAEVAQIQTAATTAPATSKGARRPFWQICPSSRCAPLIIWRRHWRQATCPAPERRSGTMSKWSRSTNVRSGYTVSKGLPLRFFELSAPIQVTLVAGARFRIITTELVIPPRKG